MGNRRNSGVLDLFNIGIIPKIHKNRNNKAGICAFLLKNRYKWSI